MRGRSTDPNGTVAMKLPDVKSLFQARQLLTVLSAQSASTYANQVIALVVPWPTTVG